MSLLLKYFIICQILSTKVIYVSYKLIVSDLSLRVQVQTDLFICQKVNKITFFLDIVELNFKVICN